MNKKLIELIDDYLNYEMPNSPSAKDIVAIIENELFKKEVPYPDNDYTKGYKQAWEDIRKEIYEP